MAAHNFKSPMPIPRSQHSTPATATANVKPATLCTKEIDPKPLSETTNPTIKNGKTSQLGMRRLRISIADAITNMTRMGYQLTEFMVF